MATLKEIYDELDRVHIDIKEYIEIDATGNEASDISRDIEGPLEALLVALDTIIDDKNAGLYEELTEDDFLEEDEDLW